VRFSQPTQRISFRTAFAPAREGDQVKSARERAEEKREAKLELVREQVRSGSLVIRQMTEEERRRYPSRPPSPKRTGRR
jgi:hypothetical protein